VKTNNEMANADIDPLRTSEEVEQIQALRPWESTSCSAAQEFHSILWNPSNQYCVHKSLPLVPTLDESRPYHPILSLRNFKIGFKNNYISNVNLNNLVENRKGRNYVNVHINQFYPCV
jgi:hypothetical protein